MLSSLFNTLETVAADTCAASATSLIVAICRPPFSDFIITGIFLPSIYFTENLLKNYPLLTSPETAASRS